MSPNATTFTAAGQHMQSPSDVTVRVRWVTEEGESRIQWEVARELKDVMTAEDMIQPDFDALGSEIETMWHLMAGITALRQYMDTAKSVATRFAQQKGYRLDLTNIVEPPLGPKHGPSGLEGATMVVDTGESPHGGRRIENW